MLELEKELLLDSLPGMAYRCQVEAPWTMQYASPGTRFVTSITPDELTSGRVHWGDRIHKADLPVVEAELADALASHRHFYFHYRFIDPLLGVRWLNEAGQGIYGPDGVATALVGFIIDATDRAEVQERLREAEHRYALAAEATGEIIWDRDLEAGTVRRIVPANSVWAQFSAPIQGGEDWWEDRIHPEDAAAVQAAIAGLTATGSGHWSAEYRLRRPDESYAHIFDQGYVVAPEGANKHRMVGAMQDISERKAAEGKLEELQAEMMHLSQKTAMGAMASTLAHELNQPLAAAANYLTGSARLAARAFDPADPLRVGIHEAGQQIHRAGEIIRRVRNLIGGDANRRETVALGALIARVKKLSIAGGGCQKLELKVRIDEAADRIAVDPIQIEQVVLNLIRNACEAAPDDSAAEVTISGVPIAGGRVEVRVEDHGAGLSDHALAILFTAYGESNSGGLGVGLSICRTIVEAHGGNIRAENNEGGGASFIFSLPAADGSDARGPEKRASVRGNRR